MKIHLLDCTLRDGGYVNNWQFGERNIKTILQGLMESGVDIVECGYLTNCVEQDSGSTKFSSIEQIETVIDTLCLKENEFAIMIDYGKYDIEKLPIYRGGPMTIIRLAFHKKDMDAALGAAKEIIRKGYKVFLQPMVSMGYTDEEFLRLIKGANEVMPIAFYIVDSFGVMKKRDLLRFFFMTQHNLNEKIWVGYHSHNNMQLAYSNAQALVEERSERVMVIDASVMGMGRGAGNLNTELFAEYLNDDGGYAYKIKPLLQISDKVLSRIYTQKYWGYSLPYYVSAVNNCHPNYSSYLAEKNSLTIDEMHELLSMLPAERKNEFDKAYIEDLYMQYMSQGTSGEGNMEEFIEEIRGKDIVVIAPGKSTVREKDRVVEFASRPDCISIAINHSYEYINTDYEFFSNIRRYKNQELSQKTKLIITSNITIEEAYLKVDYRRLINNYEGVQDNAGMMLLQFLSELPIGKVYLAGMDGYSVDINQNYSNEKYILRSDREVLAKMNEGMNNLLRQFATKMEIEFLTTPCYIHGDND